MALDQIQYAAVRHFGGPAMILAGPGSGKTTVITHRVWSLIKDRGVEQEQILVITFTKMAALEMKARFLKMGGLSGTAVNFGTFHAIFFMILKEVYGFKAEDIVKVPEQWRFVKTQLALYNVDVRDENGMITDIISEIARYKGSDAKHREVYVPRSCDVRLFKAIYDEYCRWLKSAHKVDFEDMMIRTYELFLKDEKLLSAWQQRFSYVMIDEFQDSSPIQFEIVNMLVRRHRNIFIVGDDDQSIYGFRGAAPGVMQNFKKIYPDTAVYTLNTNYRSQAAVVEAATRLINHNKDRFYKDLKAFNEYECDVERKAFTDIEAENKYVATLIKDGITTAILTRTNSKASEVKSYLNRIGIESAGKFRESQTFKHWIAQDLSSYVRLAMGGRSRADYLRIINKPSRYISRQYFVESDVNIDMILLRMRQGRQNKLAESMSTLKQDLLILGRLNPYAGINYIRKKIGYDEYVRQYAAEQGADADKLNEMLEKLQQSAVSCDTYESWLRYFEEDDKADTSEADRKNEEKTGEKNEAKNVAGSNVTICTMHSSKGLEFERIIIVDANEGITPYNKAVMKQDIEEERRLFYVAMTRAKKRLVICSVEKQYNKPLMPSRFLSEF